MVTAINSSYSLIPEDLQAPLNNQDQGTTFNKNGVIYTIEERYISALGSQCIKLSYAMNKIIQSEVLYVKRITSGIKYLSWNKHQLALCLLKNKVEGRRLENNENFAT